MYKLTDTKQNKQNKTIFTQVNTPRLNPSQTDPYSIDLPGGMEG